MIGLNSRYNYANVVRVVNDTGQIEPDHLDIRPRLTRKVFIDNEAYSIADRDTLSNISWRKLGTGKLYWVIADLSDVVDAFTDLLIREKRKVLASLTSSLTGSVTYETIQVSTTRGFKPNQKIEIEDLNTNVKYTTTVVSVDKSSLRIRVVAFTTAIGVIAAKSRVSVLYLYRPTLVIPTIQRTLFELTDFSNKMNTLVP